MPEQEQGHKHEMSPEERRLDEQNQQINDKVHEETSPIYNGSKVIFKSGIPGFLGCYKIEHTIEVKGHSLEDVYESEPKKRGHKMTIPYVIVDAKT